VTSVTLVTGDRVTLWADGGQLTPTIEPGEGREGVSFKVERRGESLYVIPLDALALVGRGELDLRLFDVASLQSAGYGDADRDDVPVILQDEDDDATVPRSKAQAAERRGDVIAVAIPLQTDAAGHRGCVVHATATTRLLRDGRPLGHTELPASGEFTVPAGEGRYRIETTVDQHPDARLSTRITAAWTFRSAHVDGDEPVALPLMAVRFTPALDRQNRVPRGRDLVVPLTVDRAGPIGRVATPAVDVSYDDGVSWTPVRVVRRPGGPDGPTARYQAVLSHPHDGDYVSLRAVATDDRGNAVEETIIRAYELR
jgi:hypothetical protein